jgi:hypothetical protein
MDLCHCSEPNLVPHGKEQTCSLCGLYYIQKEWLKDPRVLKAKPKSAYSSYRRIIDGFCKINNIQ